MLSRFKNANSKGYELQKEDNSNITLEADMPISGQREAAATTSSHATHLLQQRSNNLIQHCSLRGRSEFLLRRLSLLGIGLGFLCQGEVSGRLQVVVFFLNASPRNRPLGSVLGKEVLLFQCLPPREFDVLILFHPVRLVRRFVRSVVKIWDRSRLCILIICLVTPSGITG